MRARMTEPLSTTQVDLLEQLVDQIGAGSLERDHGIAWAKGKRTDVRKLLRDGPDDERTLFTCPLTPDETLISLYWEGAMGNSATRRLFTVRLPSDRELLLDDFDASPTTAVSGVIDRADSRAHLRAFQAAIAGRHVEDPLWVGFPTELELAFGGVVLLDALAEALRSFGHLHDYLDEDNVPYWVGDTDGDDSRRRTIIALEEELAESAADEYAEWVERLLEQAVSRPAWIWSTDAEVAQLLAAAANEEPPIPLYDPAGHPASFDPLEEDASQLRTAAAILVACGAL